jgi:hypothetical protein
LKSTNVCFQSTNDFLLKVEFRSNSLIEREVLLHSLGCVYAVLIQQEQEDEGIPYTDRGTCIQYETTTDELNALPYLTPASIGRRLGIQGRTIGPAYRRSILLHGN